MTLAQPVEPQPPQQTCAPHSTALQAIPLPTALVRAGSGQLIEVSDSFCELCGCDRAALLGRRLDELGLWVDREPLRRLLRRAERHHGVAGAGIRVRAKGGTVGLLQLHARAVEPRDGALLMLVGHWAAGSVAADTDQGRPDAGPLPWIESLPLAAVILQQGIVSRANAEAARTLGHPTRGLVGRPLLALVHADDRDRVGQALRSLPAGASASCEFRAGGPDGGLKHWRLVAAPIEEAGTAGSLLLLSDISADAGTRQRLFELLGTVEQIADAVMLTDPDGRIRYVNAGFERMTGYRRDEILGLTPAALKSGVHGPDFYRQLWSTISSGRPFHAQLVNRRKDGSRYHVVKTITPIVDDQGRIANFVNIDKDFTLQHAALQRAMEGAMTDALTGLPNRGLFLDRLNQAIARQRRSGTPFSLLFIDLDGFKSINDRLGHAAGDEVLRQVARRIADSLRSIDTVARVGGDEFVALLAGLGSRASAASIGRELIAAIGAPVSLDDGNCQVGASVGIGICPDDGNSIEALLQAADRAMYAAKRAGGRRLIAACGP